MQDLTKHQPNPTPHPVLGLIETIVVDSRVLSCDGGLGALGHPRVFLRIADHQTFCPYCSRLFVLNPEATSGDTH
ncbi:zinc-finger domain-containing protein [Gluconacetobacter entanii]|uniref:Zinc-finger domain-containing protein n=1 Tax=Gluconacetobacter entanii TaxID=108528 RepID=A0A318PW34_9PROT|nr:zinc-finger domain-containing protein [Gluconacetobacter entanii]MBE7618196.1 zinc-finger domain-containing protein [Komagataeibacter sp. FXV2]MCE2578881.1 zinc-finger domain-containing protein [Komagataeibacter sp. FNDCR1]MBY4639691.1 zinc-finger domain-containing protein [Gluconacetobacter entanii]MCW4579182.1 zinc-finger domain-containing protein [Gluconacetobacter entanii]MCW4582572.1 zinc-finger domain-containing protein [Gluconacetobacter entanii]